MAISNGTLWVTSRQEGKVSAIDISKNQLRQTISVGPGALGVTTADGAVWVTSHMEGTGRGGSLPDDADPDPYAGAVGRLDRIDAASGAVTNTVSIGADPQDVVLGASSLWVPDYESKAVFRVDPKSLAIMATIAVPQAARVAFSHGAVWVTGFGSTLTRIDPNTNQATFTDVGRDLVLPIGDPDDLQIVTQVPVELISIDRTTAQPVRVRALPKGSNPMAVIVGGEPWISVYDVLRPAP